MSRPKLNSDAEASLDYLHLKNRPSARLMSESVTVSVQGPQEQSVREEVH